MRLLGSACFFSEDSLLELLDDVVFELLSLHKGDLDHPVLQRRLKRIALDISIWISCIRSQMPPSPPNLKLQSFIFQAAKFSELKVALCIDKAAYVEVSKIHHWCHGDVSLQLFILLPLVVSHGSLCLWNGISNRYKLRWKMFVEEMDKLFGALCVSLGPLGVNLGRHFGTPQRWVRQSSW